ncbi:hypothetical protein JZU61_01010, partial [bacterium]|nr:hypothetical protein [bacterium]
HTIVGEKYEMRVGDSQITMYANGVILIQGNDIDVTGVDHVEIIAPKVYIDKGAWTPEPICWECMMNAMREGQ